MSRAMAADVIQHLATTTNRPSGADTRGDLPGVSRREEEVLALLADGLTDRQIADRLGISPRTVETHVGSLLNKLGVRNRAEAARRYRDGPAS
jgi:DNA-binding NarL/FixJ family response regulator